ncbi:MAG: PEP-CTERM sorting domain-containing protein, partial [Verrucomicrobiaceae bacterium]|nr:PEP-CTERM sorting domain-containing protein [Verrucomicrobiaceae bacterium]
GGTWNVRNGSSLNFTTGSNITTNQGSVMLDGAGSSFNRLTTALNNNQGSFTIKNDRDLTTAGAYTNSGTTRVEDSTTTMTIGAGGSAAYTQTGGVTALVNGAFIDPSVFNLNGGTLQGTGTIESSVIAGPGSSTISPGMSPGTLTINGDLTLSSGSTLVMELGGLTRGTLYDYVDVNGVLTLAGMLDLDFINDFQNSLTSGEILTLATANSAILGSFSNVASGSYLMTNFPLGLQVWYGAGSPYGAENLVVAIPEPSRALLTMLGAASLMLRRRRITERT